MLYYEAEVYKHLELIAENKRAIKASIAFPLADFALIESLAEGRTSNEGANFALSREL